MATAAAPTKPGTPATIAAPDGADIRLTTIARTKRGRGRQGAADGTPHALYFDGKRLKDFSSKPGPVNSFTGLNDRHQAVGYFASRPGGAGLRTCSARTRTRPHPARLLHVGEDDQALTLPSVAFGVNNAGWVAGTFRTNDGLLHAFLWLPLSKRRPNFADLGAGDARALADPSQPRRLREPQRGPVALSLARHLTIVGGNTVWIVNSSTGTPGGGRSPGHVPPVGERHGSGRRAARTTRTAASRRSSTTFARGSLIRYPAHRPGQRIRGRYRAVRAGSRRAAFLRARPARWRTLDGRNRETVGDPNSLPGDRSACRRRDHEHPGRLGHRAAGRLRDHADRSAGGCGRRACAAHEGAAPHRRVRRLSEPPGVRGVG